MSERLNVRRDLRAGDLGGIIAHHGRLYAVEYGVDSSFEAMVASSVGRAASHGFPSDREGVWIVERGGSLSGSLALTDEGDGTAMLRWFLLDPALRGQGLGRRMVAELLTEAEANGYARVRLETFSDLRAAAHLYRAHGFEVVRAETGPRWGRNEITYQYYVLELPRGGREAVAARAVATS